MSPLEPIVAKTCAPEPHAWAAHLGGGLIHIEICYLCKAINWAGINAQIAELVKSTVPEHLHGDGPCHRCGQDNIRWFAPNVVWNIAVGGPDCMDDPGGIYCINCFVILADEAGLDPICWQLTPEWPWRHK